MSSFLWRVPLKESPNFKQITKKHRLKLIAVPKIERLASQVPTLKVLINPKIQLVLRNQKAK